MRCENLQVHVRKIIQYIYFFSAGNAFATFQSYNKNEDPDNMNPPNMPPPLPPKKKHIMSYMEMFGRSLNNTDEELVQSLTRTKDLLEAVWQQNYHDYSYNSMSSQYDLSSGGFAGKETYQTSTVVVYMGSTLLQLAPGSRYLYQADKRRTVT